MSANHHETTTRSTRPLILALLAALLAAVPMVANSQVEGDGVLLVLPEETQVQLGVDGDLLLFTGKSQGTTAAGDCAEGDQHHSYSALLVDPGAGRAARRTEAIVLAIVGTPGTEPFRPGTRVGSFDPLGACTIGGVVYIRYRAFVQ